MEDQLSVPALESSHRHPALAVRGVSKTFFGNPAVTSFDLTIAAGEIHALLGENGSGKSTVIKILSGYHRPDHGSEILINGKVLELGSPDSSYALGARFVHQELGLIQSLSIADNLAFMAGFPCRLGTVRQPELRRAARRDLARVGLELDPETKVAALTPAERTGVAVARALRDDPASPVSLLVLDEPTATLPEAEVERLLTIVRTVAAAGVGVLYVTHRLEEVFQVASALTVLRDGIRQAQVPVAAVDRAELIGLLVGSEFDDLHAASVRLPPQRAEAVLVADRVSGGPIGDVSLEAHPGDVIGIAGITGSGRESLLAMLFGAQPRQSGTVRIAGIPLAAFRPDLAMKAGLAFLPADRKSQGSFPGLTTRENISIGDLAPLWRWPALSRRREQAEVGHWMERLSIRPRSAAGQPLLTLSGGNQQKTLFAKWLRREPRILLLDEPTQGVDIGAKADLHNELLSAARRGAGIVVSSADTEELAALCQQVLVLREGRVAARLTGSQVTARSISRACLGADERSAL
ncbi:MAG TPA: sugar ABC transporter ATP-binding protein [Streptosporangiaceae bacterium]